MSDETKNAQPIRTIVKEEEEMSNANPLSTSSSPTNVSEAAQSSSTITTTVNEHLLDQAHDGLLGLAALQEDHISDSDNDDENESVSGVSALYSLLKDDSDNESEHVSSLPPPSSSAAQLLNNNLKGNNTPSLGGGGANSHLAKRASRLRSTEPQQGDVASASPASGSSTTTKRKRKSTSTTSGSRGKRNSAAASGASNGANGDEDFEIADAGEMEVADDDEYIADLMEDDDEDLALAGVKKRSSSRRERSPNLGAISASTDSNGSSETAQQQQIHPEEIISEEDLIHCVVCKRSNLQVNFKKNYTINTNNYKTYCETFPCQCDQIPKPRDGESLSVCSTCYNKQWRFARGQYDPNKSRAVNKREGLKKPPKLKDSPRMEGGDTPTLGSSTPTLDSAESPAVEGKSRRKVTKRKASTSTEDSLNTSGIKEETDTTIDETAVETPKKKVKRAAKAKKHPLPPVQPEPATSAISSTSTVHHSMIIPAAAVAANMGATNVATGGVATVPISTLIPGTVTIINANQLSTTSAIPSPSPKRGGGGRKSKNPPANIGVVSSAPASSYKKEETISPPPVISNTSLLISYLKRNNGALEEIYTTKIVTSQCPDTSDQLRDLVMERLTQKKGDLFTFDRACCNSVDRFNNSIKVEVDEFFFNDVKLNNNDSLCIYVNDKQQ